MCHCAVQDWDTPIEQPFTLHALNTSLNTLLGPCYVFCALKLSTTKLKLAFLTHTFTCSFTYAIWYDHSGLLRVCWNVSNIWNLNCVWNLLHGMWYEYWNYIVGVYSFHSCSLFALIVFPGQQNFLWHFFTCQKIKCLYCCTRFTWRVQYEYFV